MFHIKPKNLSIAKTRQFFTIIPEYKQGVRLNFGKFRTEIKGKPLSNPFFVFEGFERGFPFISGAILESMSVIRENWGVAVSTIQIKDMEFDQSMKNAMSTVAEATRQAEAKIINAKADIETAKQYNEAAKFYSENPLTMRLREFQLWNSVSKNPSNTIYVVPSNLLDLMNNNLKKE